MQDPKNWKAECRTCGALKGKPCLTADGYLAERVHWGRPGMATPLCKLEGRGKELLLFLVEFTVIADLVPRIGYVATKEMPTLWPGSNVCADCGEPYDQPGLLDRCQQRHPARVGRVRVGRLPK
jgi:hypothetical protein